MVCSPPETSPPLIYSFQEIISNYLAMTTMRNMVTIVVFKATEVTNTRGAQELVKKMKPQVTPLQKSNGVHGTFFDTQGDYLGDSLSKLNQLQLQIGAASETEGFVDFASAALASVDSAASAVVFSVHLQ
ncbi:hypothetical protein SADUNF_Sadunf11G0119100 [Salix dunnii]|uniref:Uncharacterized protein n=1 Tax=Salix dunnii TaxID=1413687 RepID=A0A835JRF4_9ROSI|nr:hypothetical protein SADUNF_Sadunf11G0119100 [Salix dunnii]